MIRYQILQTNTMTIVWQTVRRITSEILGVKELKQNLIICRQVKEEIKGLDICYIKRNPLNKNKAEAYYLRVFVSGESYNRYFLAIIFINM